MDNSAQQLQKPSRTSAIRALRTLPTTPPERTTVRRRIKSRETANAEIYKTRHRRTDERKQNQKKGRNAQRLSNGRKPHTATRKELLWPTNTTSISNEASPPPRKQETTDSKQTESYRAPRYDDPLAQMGVEIVTSELKMDCAILVEEGGTTLQDHIQYRTTLGGGGTQQKPAISNRATRNRKSSKDPTHCNVHLPYKLTSEKYPTETPRTEQNEQPAQPVYKYDDPKT